MELLVYLMVCPVINISLKNTQGGSILNTQYKSSKKYYAEKHSIGLNPVCHIVQALHQGLE